MKNILATIIFAFLCGSSLNAQLDPFAEASAPRHGSFQLYEEGIELFEKNLYGAAYQKFEDFLETESVRGIRTGTNNDIHALAKYHQAVCAYELDRNDAVHLLEQFTKEYPENTESALANYFRGKYYFNRRNYEAAIAPLVEAEKAASLTAEREGELMFMLGYSYFFEEKNQYADLNRAVRYFNQLSNFDNSYQEDARYYKAVILYKQEDYGRAYEALKSVKNSRKYGAETQVYLANTLLKLKRYKELFELADELMKDNRRKKDPSIYHMVANASYEDSLYDNAVRYFNEFLDNRGKLSRNDNFRMAYANYKLSNYKDAIPYFRKVLRPEDSIAQVGSYYLGFCYLNTQKNDEAKYAFRKAVMRDDEGMILFDVITEDALFQYAKISFVTQDYTESRKALVEYIDFFNSGPYIDEARTLLGDVWLMDRDYRAAINYFESFALNTRRAREAYQIACYHLGLEQYEQKAYVSADTFFRKAIGIDQDHTMTLSALYWMGESAYRQNNFNEASRNYQAFLQDNYSRGHSYYSAIHYGLGWSNFKSKKYNTALRSFQTFLKESGKRAPKRIMVDANLRAGDCLFMLRRYSEANRYYSDVIKTNYSHQDNATYQLAESYYRQQKYQQSVSTFSKLINSYPKSGIRDNALDRISEIYATWIKDYRQAANYANMLVRQYPKSPLAPDAYNRLGLAAYNSGRTDVAGQYFKKVVNDYSFDKKNVQIALDNLSVLLPANEYDRILADYRKNNPNLDTKDAERSFNIGLDRFFSENYASAINQFTDYITHFKNGPNYFEALLYRAQSYKAINQPANALQDYAAIYNSPGKNPQTNSALKEAAEIYFDQRDYQQSIALYETLNTVAEAIPNRVQALFGIARNYKAQQQYPDAIRTLNQIIDNIEVEVGSRTKAQVETGECHYLSGNLQAAFGIFKEVEANFKNEEAAISQYWITSILFDQGRYEDAKEAGIYMKNTYPSFNYWKARTFLVVAEANYQLGEVFQAKGVLESLIAEERFPDIQDQARRRLSKIEAEENTNTDFNNPEDPRN